MSSSGPSPDLVAEAEKLNVSISDPVTVGVSEGNVIGVREGKRYGRRASSMTKQE